MIAATKVFLVFSPLLAQAAFLPKNDVSGALAAAKVIAGVTKPREAEFQNLHKQIETLATGLESMSGSLASTKIGPELHTFVGELRKVLDETKDMKNQTLGIQKLQAAKDSMAGLTKDLNAQQEALMKEGDSEKESLLLGVLMTKQKEPMSKQLEVLQSSDFSQLAVAKALVAKHDNKTALFAQAADFLDHHAGKADTQALIGKANEHVQAQKKAEAIAESFEQRVKTMEKNFATKEKTHNLRMKEMKKASTQGSKRSQTIMVSALKKEARTFKKWSVSQQHDIDTMKSAATAIRNGDMKALNRARDALEQSMKNMQSKNSGFLVLLTLGHQLMERDCPYCAAQCVEKCHTAGKPYVACMTDCADAGKGF